MMRKGNYGIGVFERLIFSSNPAWSTEVLFCITRRRSSSICILCRHILIQGQRNNFLNHGLPGLHWQNAIAEMQPV